MVVNGVFEPNWFYKTKVNPADSREVLLISAQELPVDAQLVYGYGFNPFCQLADEAGMAVPAFGPVNIA